VTSHNALSMVTKYMPPCCVASYVGDSKQNRYFKYTLFQKQFPPLNSL